MVYPFSVQIKIQHVLRERVGKVLYGRQAPGCGEEGTRLLASGGALAQQTHHRRVNIGTYMLVRLYGGLYTIVRGNKEL